MKRAAIQSLPFLLIYLLGLSLEEVGAWAPAQVSRAGRESLSLVPLPEQGVGEGAFPPVAGASSGPRVALVVLGVAPQCRLFSDSLMFQGRSFCPTR